MNDHDDRCTVYIPDGEGWISFTLPYRNWQLAELPYDSYSKSPMGNWYIGKHNSIHEHLLPKTLRLWALLT